jgi:hypothetical protein
MGWCMNSIQLNITAGFQESPEAKMWIPLAGVGLLGVGLLGRCVLKWNSFCSKKVNQFAQKEFLNIKIYHDIIKKFEDEGGSWTWYATHIYTDTTLFDNILFLNNVGFTSECKYLKIILHECNNHIKQIQLPDQVSSKILHFLKTGRPDPRFCCHDFVNYVFNKYKVLNSFYLSDWNYKVYLGDEFLSPGDAVLLHVSAKAIPQRPKDYRHSAIYLGYNVYMSLYGQGPIMLTSMDHMQKFYHAESVIVLYRK